jgi:pantoate--beta-alanine ligase
MILVHDLENLQQALVKFAEAGKRVALVPTMGALHAGHASLIRKARETADAVVVSIFVNPKQFGVNEDFAKYPRTLEADKLIARDSGADIIYAPSVEDLYPQGFATSVSVGEMGKILCGKFRLGHFDGVATIVTKLLMRVMPHVAIFGMKDYQQLCIIEKIVEDLDLPVEIMGAKTLREADGLAMSSRNAYLSQEERKTAPLLYQTLEKTVKEIEYSGVEVALAKGRDNLTNAGFKIDYLELVDGDELTSLNHVEEGSRLVVAAWLGKTRLIDNIVAG